MTLLPLDEAGALAQQLRWTGSGAAAQAGSGHPTSCMSAADLMAVLLTRYLRFDWQHPDSPANDHLIFSKGHASPLLYSMFKAAGVVSDEELVTRTGSSAPGWRATPPRSCRGWTWRPGHSARGCPTGWASRWPGSTWTSCRTASGCCAGTARWPRARCGRRSTRPRTTGCDNLVAIIDMNRLGQRGPTELGWDTDAYAAGRGIRLPGHRDRRARPGRDRQGDQRRGRIRAGRP